MAANIVTQDAEAIKNMLTALGYFKDWSNYLLVTSVGSLGWVSTKPLGISRGFFNASLGCLTLAIIFGMLTLALVPIVAQNLHGAKAFYEVSVTTKPLLFFDVTAKIKFACWPQHVFFILGISLYAIGVIRAGPQSGGGG